MTGWRKHARSRRVRPLNWRPAWLLVAALIGGMSLLAAGTAGPAAGAGTARAGSAGSIPAAPAAAFPAGARVIGPAPGGARLHITLALRSRDPDGLTALARQVSTPSSSRYRHFLRPRQVKARFGSSPAAIATLRSWLHGHGLTVGPTTGDGLLLPATGSVAAIEQAFRTPIRLARLADGRIAHANSRPARVPAAAAPWVVAVLGLDNLVLPSAYLHGSGARQLAAARQRASRPAAGPAATPRACAAARATPATFTADELARAYGFEDLYRRGLLGHGVTVGLFELADYASSDVTAYTRCYGIRPVIRRVRIDGGTTVRASGQGVEEITSDIETVAGMAPRARILVYEAPPSSLATLLDNYGALLQQDRAQVISSSYGYCEPVLLAGHRGLIDAEAGIFAGMALQGQSMLAASGDAGSEACLPFLQNLHGRAYRLAVGDPASQPYVTGVGGTAIVRYGVPPVQTAWNQTGRSGLGTGFRAPFNGRGGRPATYPGNLAGSGGISQVWRMPRWQRGFDASGNSSGLPCGAVLGGTCREVPDVSALAAGDARATPGYAIYGTAGPFRGAGWVSVGGTSLASPLWAAFAALADQQVFPHRLGLLSPALYQIDRSDPGAFTDVRAGNNNYLARGGFPANDSCRDRNRDRNRDQDRDRHRGPCYQAGAGYDMATGLGSPRAGRLADDLAAGT